MSNIDALITSVEGSPRGGNTLAIFDFDGTLIAGYSALFVLREQIRRKDLANRDLARIILGLFNHHYGMIDDQALMELGAAPLAGRAELDFSDLCRRVYERHLFKRIYPEARALIEAHRRQGHTVAIASSAPGQAIADTASELGVDHIVSSHYRTENGTFTGGVAMPVCWGYGKRLAAESLASKLDISLDTAFFYSDSDEDLPLLEHVQHAIAVNPNDGLRHTAARRHWPCVDFKPRRWQLRELASTAGVYSSLVGTYLAGLGIAKFLNNPERGRGFMLRHFTDSVCSLIGMRIELINEHFLRDSLPAVVLFNHQSTADGFIILQLLQENYAGIGKRAFGRIPLLSEAYEFAGVIPIDRSDSKGAIASMAPLVDAIKEQGRSVAIAPEGTRSLSRRPGPFKKGAFHLALDAGVKIVPVVIHNSVDVQTKGDPLYHSATVKVEILPPVETSHWQRDNLDKHIADVRQLYLDALGFSDADPASQLT